MNRFRPNLKSFLLFNLTWLLIQAFPQIYVYSWPSGHWKHQNGLQFQSRRPHHFSKKEDSGGMSVWLRFLSEIPVLRRHLGTSLLNCRGAHSFLWCPSQRLFYKTVCWISTVWSGTKKTPPLKGPGRLVSLINTKCEVHPAQSLNWELILHSDKLVKVHLQSGGRQEAALKTQLRTSPNRSAITWDPLYRMW